MSYVLKLSYVISIPLIYTAVCTGGDVVSYVGPVVYVSLSCCDVGTDAQCLIAIHCAVPTLVLKYSWPPSRLRRGKKAERRGASAERRPVFIKPCPTAVVDTPSNQAERRDSVDLVGDLRPEVLLGRFDDYHPRMFVGSIR